MSTSINSSGVTFPDATTQTTAATASPIPAGTVVLFYQSAAPTGWTQVTSLNDYDLRLVSGTGGTTGGTTAYSTVFANQAPTTGATTLSTAQMPSHVHYNNNNSDMDPPYWGNFGGYGSTLLDPVISSTPTGGGGSHTHPGGTVTLNVRYANIIICSKN